jgi:type I restriction enzyme S subunit
MQKLFTEGIGHTRFKDTKIGRIPEEWEVVKLDEITKIMVGKDVEKDRYSKHKDEKYLYPVFSNTVSDYGLYGYYDFPEYEGNSLTIIGRGVGLGTAFSRVGGFGAIGRLLVLFPETDVDEIFLSYYVNYKKPFFVESSAIPQLTGIQSGKYKVVKPPHSEQKQIAQILSEVDTKIEKEEATKAELEQLKKGLMQVLLTGKLRVKVEA